MSTMMQWAQYYRSQGLSVIPVSGKVPLIKWAKYQEVCASEEEIKAWWEKWPDGDVGIVTGPISRLLVVDFDRERPEELIPELVDCCTPTVRTKRGYQYYFTWPDGFTGKSTLAGVLESVDVRGVGGYVKAVPSRFSDGSGRYDWIKGFDTPIADCPQWLIELMSSKQHDKLDIKKRESETSWLKEKLDGLAVGNRNHTFTSIAGSLRSRGYSSSDIYLLLASKAQDIGFDAEELRTICSSVGGYSPRFQVNEEAQSISDFLKDEQKVEWLVPGLIAKNSIGFIHGQPQTAKSWMAFDLAITVAKGGGHWLGKFPTNGAKVLLIEAERFKGETQRRLRALLSTANVPMSDIGSSLKVKTGSTTRLNLSQSLDAFKRLLSEVKPELVIWDSFATAHTVGETDRMSIQAVLETIKSLRNEFGCAFFFVNHDTKQSLQHQPGESKQPSMNDMQGNTAVAAAAELMFGVRRKDNESCMVYNTKNTLANTIDPFEVQVIDVDEEKTKIRVEGR